MGFLTELAGTIASTLLAAEVRDCSPALSDWCVRLAARRLISPEARMRYEEEWLAHLSERPGRLLMVGHALGCLIASCKMKAPVLPKLRWHMALWKAAREIDFAYFRVALAYRLILLRIEKGKYDIDAMRERIQRTKDDRRKFEDLVEFRLQLLQKDPGW